MSERARLAIGPALAMMPPSLRETKPDISTAPGAAIINPKKLIMIANTSIMLLALNSACL